MIEQLWFRKQIYLLALLLLALAGFSQGGVTPTTLRYGTIDAQIVSGTLNGNQFNGTINWAGATNAPTGNLTVTDNGSGLLVVTVGTTSLQFPQPYTPQNGNWSYNSKAIFLNNSGASGDIELLLPEGIQYKKQESDLFYRESTYGLDIVPLDQDARVTAPVDLTNKLSRIRVENEPFNIQVSGFSTFDDVNGFLLVSGTLLHDFSDEFDINVRPSNTGWLYRSSLLNTPQVTHQGLQFQAEQKGTSEDYDTAFPAALRLNNANWSITYENSELTTGQITTTSVVQNYLSEPCSPGSQVRSLTLGPTTFDVGPDWALMGVPNSAAGPNLELVFDAYEIGPMKRDGVVYIPGDKALGETNLEDFLPSNYLLSGRVNVEAASDFVMASFPEQAYTEGLGNYAGWNLEREGMESVDFSLQMACVNAPFSASDSCKIYVRRGGVSGSLDASASSVANLPPLQLYGEYDTVLTKFNISFLDNIQWQESAIDGTLTLPFPSDVAFEFKSLELDTCGSPGAAKIKTFESILAYWNRSFKFRGLEFRDVLNEQGDPVLSSCGTQLRTLWTSSSNSVPEVSKALLVDANFSGNGNIADIVITSEPKNTLQGWPYTLRELYYSKWDNSQNINGKTIVVGDMKLPFWGATPVVAFFDTGTIPQVFDGRSYAQTPVVDIDPDRNGFPAGISTVEQYLNATNRRPMVKSSFANIIDLEYRVKYDNLAKRFATASGEENSRDLIVLDINSQVRGITKSDTEVLFAAEFGVPAINVSSLLENLADPALQQLMGPIKENMNVVNTALSGQLSQAIRGGMEDLTRPAVTSLVNNIRTAAANANGPLSAAELAVINAQIDTQIGALETLLKGELAQGTGPIIGKIDDILESLENIANKIESLDPAVVEQILVALIELADADPSGVQQIFGDVEAARAYIVEELINGQLKPQLQLLRNQLADLGTLPELDALISGSEFESGMDDVRDEMLAIINQLKNNSAAVRNLDPDTINTKLVNALYNSFFFKKVNQLTAKIFEPLKMQIQNILNGFFDTLNNQIKAYLALIGESLSGITEQINDITGVAAAKMSGYAIFGGESLDRLHIDADFSLKVPDEDFSFLGSLDMERFKNNSNAPVCGTPVGAESIKTKIAVYGIPLRFPRSSLVADQIALILRLNQNAPDAPFFVSDVGGLIETTGSLDFEAAKVLSPSFAAGVGANETYIAFSGGIVFSKASMRGGIFLGRTCNGVEILEAIDPEVGGLFTQDVITGIYAFGEAAIPIVDYSCLLRVGATAGAGFWYFVEGPTYGGKMTAGVYGEGLCLVAVRGKIVLIGGKQPTGYFFKGTGWVAGGIGWCEPEQWFNVDNVWADKWCATCVLWLEAIYQQGWSVDYSAECGL